MVDFSYLYRGLCGLSRAYRANNMAGHLGAAVVAGYFFGEDYDDLDADVAETVGAYLDRIIGGEEGIWFDENAAEMTVAEMFAPVESEDENADLTDGLADALANNIGAFRQSGHNVIFTSIAIRALRDHPVHATPTLVDGIRKLVAGFDSSAAGRGYYGADKGWLEAEDVELDESVPRYDTLADMAGVLLEEFVRSGHIRRRGYGGGHHVINHAAALVELTNYGYGDLAKRGLSAQRHHVQLWKTLPNIEDETGALVAAPMRPQTAEFWTTESPNGYSAHLTHRIKTLYGFARLASVVEDAALARKANETLRYLM